jgi:hypothetical protein
MYLANFVSLNHLHAFYQIHFFFPRNSFGGKNGILLFFFSTISSMSRNQKLPTQKIVIKLQKQYYLVFPEHPSACLKIIIARLKTDWNYWTKWNRTVFSFQNLCAFPCDIEIVVSFVRFLPSVSSVGMKGFLSWKLWHTVLCIILTVIRKMIGIKERSMEIC